MEKAKATWAALDENVKKAAYGALALVLVLVGYLVFFWVPSCASAKTCKELKDAYGGWDLHNPGQRGDQTVCGESDNGLGPDGTTQCYGGMNSNAATANVQDNSRGGWENANDICTGAGARLCSVAELMNEVTRGTGCQHDAEMTWSWESCSYQGVTGHIVVQGGQHRGDEACPDECSVGWSSGGNEHGRNCATCECTPRCAPDTNPHAVRCCADADLDAAIEKCEAYVGYHGQLKLPPPQSRTMDTIGADAANTASSVRCHSASSCMELQKLYGGWPVGATNDQIRAGSVTNGDPSFFGDQSALERHETGVCGESDNGLGDADSHGVRTNQCYGGVSAVGGGEGSSMGKHINGWSHALDICQGVGARLCTVEELLAENTRNTGCNHDCQMVWSSQTHPECGANHHVVAQGGLNCAYMICPEECPEYLFQGEGVTSQSESCHCSERCAADTESHAVRCCADVFFEAGNHVVDLTADLPTGNCHFAPCVLNPQVQPSCRIDTEHAPGGTPQQPAANGIRICGAASSSTVGWGGEPDKAIDGRHCSEYGDGSCTHTDAGGAGDAERHTTGEPAWWQVDLGGPATIEHVDIWHRTGCGESQTDPLTGAIITQSDCNARLNGAHIFVSDLNRDPRTGGMWTVSSCTAAASGQFGPQCYVCGIIEFAVGQQPEGIVCDINPVTQRPPRGRFVSVSHVMEYSGLGQTGVGMGGTSGGTVVTICEAKVFGTREAFGTSHSDGSGFGGYLNTECSVFSGRVIQPPPPPPSCASQLSCAQLQQQYGGWVERTNFATVHNVCGESDNGLGGCGQNQCFGGVTSGGNDYGAGVIAATHTDTSTGGWLHANSICTSIGARLCTADELIHEVGRGSGCQHDGEMVWTSDTCDPSLFGLDESAHVTVQGGTHRGDEACPDECSNGWAHGDCVGNAGCGEQELTKGLSTGNCHFDGCVGTDQSPGTCSIITRDASGGGSCTLPPDTANPGARYEPANANANQCPPGQTTCNEAAYNAGISANQCVNGKRICGATSSSTVGWGGEPDRALDQTVHGAWNQMSCTHTDAGASDARNYDGSPHGPAWWQVDLGEPSIIQHVDLWHRTDCCQDRLEAAGVYVSDTPDFTGGKLCGRLTDHSQAPEISQCGGVIGQFVTVAHDRDNGGSSDGAVVTICEAKVFGVRGTVDQAKCTCTPRCAQDSLNMAVRCCADVRPHDAGIECAVRQTAGYSGPLKAAIVGVGTPWYMYVLYFALAAAVIVGLVKFWPLIATKIPKGGSLKASGSGLADTIAPDAGSSIYG